MPNQREAYHGELNRDDWGLVPVAQLANYKGLWFATFDPKAPSLREYLGEMAWYIDTFVDRREGGIEILATHKWVMPCNWKFPAENFGGDAYHVQWNHLSAVKVAFSRGATANPNNAGRMVSPGNGHGLICIGPDEVGDAPMPEIEDYEREIAAEVRERLGPRAGADQSDRRHGVSEFLAVARHVADVPGLAAARAGENRGVGRSCSWTRRRRRRSNRRSARRASRGFSPSGIVRAGRYG